MVARVEWAGEIDACRAEGVMGDLGGGGGVSAVRGPELSNRVFLCRINERAFCFVHFQPNAGPNSRGDGDAV